MRLRRGRRIKKRGLRQGGGGRSLYDKGYNAGYHAALGKQEEGGKDGEQAYKNGLYDGGEGIIDALMPGLEILPDHTVREVIEAGISQLQPHYLTLLGANEVAERCIHALTHQEPLSVVRLGDGELLTLAQGAVMDTEAVRKEGHFLSYAGIEVPDLAARDLLVESVRAAHIVGVPKPRLPNFQPLAFAAFRAYGMDYRAMQLTVSTINYSLHLEGKLEHMLSGRKILIVGNQAESFASLLSGAGYQTAGAVAPVDGVHDVARVMNAIANYQFDIALVSAGIAAVIIAQRIASELGKVAIDFGHLVNSFIKGEAVL